MTNVHPRIQRERRTVEAMIALYCRQQHGCRNGLCRECADLADYTRQRLEKCPFQAGKTTCARCPIHCYRPDRRVQIRAVMRIAGPRMIWRHPALALQHLLDGLRKEPAHPAGEKTGRSPAE